MSSFNHHHHNHHHHFKSYHEHYKEHYEEKQYYNMSKKKFDAQIEDSRSQPIVSDAGPLISLSENCLVWILRGIDNPVVIPRGVEFEAVSHPLKLNQYELNAMRIKEMIVEGEILVDPTDVRSRAKEISSIVNNLLYYKNRPITIFHEGEAEVLALALERKLDTVVIDERTARLVIENPRQIQKYMESRLGTNLELKEDNAQRLEDMFRNMNVLRSTELAIFAYENGFLSEYGNGPQVLEATLYALKHGGCAISNDEISEYIKIISSIHDF